MISSNKYLKRSARIVESIILLAVFTYIFWLLFSNWSQVRAANVQFNVAMMVLSLPFAVLYLVGRAFIWHLMVQDIVSPIPFRFNVAAWMSSIIGKYLPGKVFLLMGRVHFCREFGASPARISLAFLIEACSSCLAASLVFCFSIIPMERGELNAYRGLALWGILFLVVLSHPTFLELTINIVRRLARRPRISLGFAWTAVLRYTLLLALNWLVLGTGFYVLIRAMYPLPIQLLPYTTGAFALAGVVGILVLFAPSGIGVREGVMVVALTIILPAGVAALIALVSRIWMTFAEVLCSGLAIGWLKAQGRKGSEMAEHSSRSRL